MVRARKAVVLLSGGLDSTTCLAIAKSQGFECYAISFDYGQRHSGELEAAKVIAQAFDVKKHLIVPLPMQAWETSALTNTAIAVQDYSGSTEVPATYVPARNTIFLSFAVGFAEVVGATDIFIGVSSVDYSGYADCRPEFINAFERVANLGTKEGVENNSFKIHAPLNLLSKAETIRKGLELGVDYSMTVSCYRLNSAGEACGKCDSCMLRKKGFVEGNFADPTAYAAS